MSVPPVSPEQLLKKHLGKTARKHWRRILCDIKAVACGIKPSFLYDYSSIEPVQLSKMVADLNLLGPTAKNDNLFVLSLGQDTFLADISSLRTSIGELHRALQEGTGIAVDVSDHLQQPGLVGDEAVQRLTKHIGDILTQLRGIHCKEDTVLELQPQSDWNFSSIFGVLLGYPVVYWYDDVKDASNCLSMVPLRVHNVKLEADHPNCSRDLPHLAGGSSDILSSEHPIYSFSVPDHLVPHFQDRIDDWFRDLQVKTHCKLEMICNSVTLPVVTL